MNLVKNFKKKDVRIILINGNPFFAAEDVCNALEIKNSRQAISYLDKDDVITNDGVDTIGRKSKMNYVNESGLYQLVFKSRKESAKKFKRWVTLEVLPSIRKTGKYSVASEVRKMSAKHRNTLTSQWASKGIRKPGDFRDLTIEEYRQLFNNTDIRKPQMSEGEILMLSAFEALETLKLYNNSEIGGFADCKISISETASNIKKLK